MVILQKDAKWIAELQQHGLVQASSKPDGPQRELTRYRRSLTEERSREEDPDVLAGLAKGRVREKKAELEQALRGLMGRHQRYMLAKQLEHLDFRTGKSMTWPRRWPSG